jgi:hypothetical protein
VEIASDDGAYLRMRPLGYQFGVEPPEDPDELDDWDDWLIIAGEVSTADGRTWSFNDPCLTTEEAGDLGQWLRRHAAGDAAPDASLLFTEPNLAFRALTAQPPRRLLQVDFSYESLPPWMPGSGLERVFPLTLDVPADVLAPAADQWAAEIAAYPRRID